jgi:methyl-accepting chemotaxis protein
MSKHFHRPQVLRITGYVLVTAAVIGLISNLAGLVVVAVVQRRAETAVGNGLNLLDQALVAAADGLAVADRSLTQVAATLASTEATLRTSSDAVGETLPALASLSDTLATDIPEILAATQGALVSAQTSARAVDDLLGGLSGLPFLGGLAQYSPETPLNQSIGQVNASLDALPASIADLNVGLTAATTGAIAIQGDLDEIAQNLGQMDTGLADARTVVAQYAGLVEEMKGHADSLRDRVPIWLSLARWGVSFMLLWLAVAQVAILTQGLELIERGGNSAAG